MKLRNVVFSISAVFDQKGKDVIVFLAGVFGTQPAQFFEHNSPSVDLLLCVFYVRKGFTAEKEI